MSSTDGGALEGTGGRDYAALIDDLFCRPKSPFPGFFRETAPEILVDDLLVRARLERHHANYDVTVFDGVDGFAGELWERSAKTLLRLRALGHPGLPVMIASKQRPAERVAFTITEERGGLLNLSHAVAWAEALPLAAFEQFSLLLDALKRLHGARIMHRLMLPTAFQQIVSADGAEPRLCLSRFEMSALISNVIRRVVGGNAGEVRSTVRQLYLTPAGGASLDSEAGARHMAFLAPEVHPYLFDEHHRSRRDWDTTDLFGLGVLGWELFCGGLPQRLPIELAAVAGAGESGRVRALAELHAAMREALRDSPEVPKPLKDVLANMLAAEPASRESSFTLSRKLERSWDAIRAEWEPPTQKPYLMAFMPGESTLTIYNDRHWISRSPRDAAGREELRAFLQKELEGAYLVHSLTGAEGYATGPSDVLQEAEWVLIGKRAVWFCAYLSDRPLSGVGEETHEDTLVIKYLREHSYAKELFTAHPRRRVPPIDLVAFFPGQSLEDKRNGRPSWAPLTESVDRQQLRDRKNVEFLQSLDFLLDYQRASLDARIYPYITEESDGPIVTLQYDEMRDDAWRQRSPLMAAFARDPRRRPPLGDFVERLDTSDGWTQLSLDGRPDRPAFTGQSRTVQFYERKDEHSITVRVQPGVHVATRGWLRPADDSGSRPQLSRQLRARQALEAQPALISELRDPAPMEIGQQQWDVDPEHLLEGNTPGIILAMLSRLPLYALQGPPGSGKTTAVANALKLFLATERGAKVLVSAQSNFALDNLAERLVKMLPDAFIVLREVGQRAAEDKVSKAVQRFTIERLTRQTLEDVTEALQARLDRHGDGRAELGLGRRLTEAERQISADWLRSVESDQLELADRLRSGASVVLATCSVAGTTLEDAIDITDSFDWVIVEEAAKAWPTELIIPMTMGNRWTLVGDHRQLGAHRGEDVEKFLASLRDHPNETVRLHYDARHKRLEVLELFRTLFDAREAMNSESDELQSRVLAGRSEGLGRLDMQFRMHEAIAEPVRRVFYPLEPMEYDELGFRKSFLESHQLATKPHGVLRPECLSGRALVWLDTANHLGCEAQPMWSNDGEVDVIERLVSRMDPPAAPPDEDGPNSLVVLTPYLAQVKKLQGRSVVSGRVFTVHSFQGREADRVIVSLVRTTRISDDPARNIGHVGKDEVANVLLSRAKRLLVLVGRFEHFRDNGGPTWRAITTMVEQFGTVVPPEEWTAP